MSLEAPPWIVALLDAVSVWDLLLILAAVVATVQFVRKKGWRTVKAAARGILNTAEILAAVQGLPDWQARIETKVDGIHHETHKNDGSSVKDAVDRTEAAATRLELSVEGLHGRMDTVESDVKILRADTAELRAVDDELRADIENTQPPKGKP